MTSAMGHNRGPWLDEGVSWRKHCWTEARRALLPTLPLEVVRLRVQRARDVGLDYRTYATVRATSGHDVVALLFSSNALRLFAPLPALSPGRAEKLTLVRGCERLAAVHPPLVPGQVVALSTPLLHAATIAPAAAASWRFTRDALHGFLQGRGLPRDGVVVIGDTDAERGWVAAAALAGYVGAARYFDAPEA